MRVSKSGSAMRKLFGAGSYREVVGLSRESGPVLRIGDTPAGVQCVVPTPAIIHTHGANGCGRRTLLLSFAEDVL